MLIRNLRQTADAKTWTAIGDAAVDRIRLFSEDEQLSDSCSLRLIILRIVHAARWFRGLCLW